MAYFNRLFGVNQNNDANQQNNSPSQLLQLNNSGGAAGFSSGGGVTQAAAPVQKDNGPTRSGMNFINSQRYFDQNPGQNFASKINARADDVSRNEVASNSNANQPLQSYSGSFWHPQDVDEGHIKSAIGNLTWNKGTPQYEDAYGYLSGLLNVDFKDPGRASWTPSDKFTQTKDMFNTSVADDKGKNNLIKSFSTNPNRYTGGELALDRLLFGGDAQANEALTKSTAKLNSTADSIKAYNDDLNATIEKQKSTEADNAKRARQIMTGIYDQNKDIIGNGKSVWDVDGTGSPFSGTSNDQRQTGTATRNTTLDQYRSLAKLLGIDPGEIQINPNVVQQEAKDSNASWVNDPNNPINADQALDVSKLPPELLKHVLRAQGGKGN